MTPPYCEEDQEESVSLHQIPLVLLRESVAPDDSVVRPLAG